MQNTRQTQSEQQTARGNITSIAFCICFSQSNRTLRTSCVKKCCLVETSQTLQTWSQNLFLGYSKPLKKSPQSASFISSHQHLGQLHKNLWTNWKSSHIILHLLPFLSIVVLPLPLHPRRWGECLICRLRTAGILKTKQNIAKPLLRVLCFQLVSMSLVEKNTCLTACAVRQARCYEVDLHGPMQCKYLSIMFAHFVAAF